MKLGGGDGVFLQNATKKSPSTGLGFTIVLWSTCSYMHTHMCIQKAQHLLAEMNTNTRFTHTCRTMHTKDCVRRVGLYRPDPKTEHKPCILLVRDLWGREYMSFQLLNLPVKNIQKG